MRDNPAYQDIQVAIHTDKRSPTAWYGFGSFFRESKPLSDIDLLAVCADVERASAIRQEMAMVCNDWPVHLLIMTEAEAEETNFIQSQQCIPLFNSESLPSAAILMRIRICAFYYPALLSSNLIEITDCGPKILPCVLALNVNR